MKKIPSEYVVNIFYKYVGFPSYKRSTNNYNGCCPICKEGNSWGIKKRLYYIPDEEYIYCHNCQKSYSPIEWIKEVSGMDYKEILDDIDTYCNNGKKVIKTEDGKEKSKNNYILPYNAVNLFDEKQLSFYKNEKTIKDALKIIKERRLDTAINKVNLFLSLKDVVHKNRIIIPFYNKENKIDFYQSRSIYEEDEKYGKYISKINAEKTIFNINKIQNDFGYIFIFEGPIDAMFVKNGIAIGGLSVTNLQRYLLQPYIFHKKIWILDNQRIDDAAKEQTIELLKRKETVFIWPKNFDKFKDINELCCFYNKDYIKPEFFIKNSKNVK